MMDRINHKKFINTTKLLLWCDQTIGLITFDINTPSFKLSKIRSFLNITASAVLLPFAIYHIFMHIVPTKLISFYKSTAILEIAFEVIFIVTVWMTGAVKHSKIAHFLNKMIRLDERFQSVGLQIDTVREKRRIKIHFFLRSLFAIMLPLGILLISQDVIANVLLFIFIVVKSGVAFQTIEFVSIIRNRFVILNRYIEESISKYKHAELVMPLCKSCDLHHRLSKLIKQLNATYGLILLLMFTSHFIFIVVSIFYMSAYLISNPIMWDRVMLLTFWSAFFIVNVLYICNQCYNTVEETKQTKKIIHKIQSENMTVMDVVEMFSQQIESHNICFTAVGFFRIDHTLLSTIVGGATTYFIILIQLSSSLLPNDPKNTTS
ncbi:gustatory receptor 122 [Tribolium castaneum]|uniref:Gustatory receptor n=1 Tax=Tribolium castaneum TaxID=7070 RepID=D6WQ05_TRICA|nr:gustatory receptor 122 [Tribolium castaneum]